MILIEITTSDGESWTEPYHGSADEARAEFVDSVLEFEPLLTIVKVERVER